MEFSILIIIILISFLLIVFFSKRKQTLKATESDKKKQLVVSLYDLEKEIISFRKEKEMKPSEILAVHKELNNVLDEAVGGNLTLLQLEEKVAKIVNSTNAIKSFTQEQYIWKEQIKQDVSKEVNSFKFFLEKNSVYPKDFLFSANKLQGFLVDLDKERGKALILKLNEIESYLKSFQKEMKYFRSLHHQISIFIKKHPDLDANHKQELYFHLNHGDLEKAEILFNQIKGGNSVHVNEVEK